jgi:hypothetical protein
LINQKKNFPPQTLLVFNIVYIRKIRYESELPRSSKHNGTSRLENKVGERGFRPYRTEHDRKKDKGVGGISPTQLKLKTF